MRPYIITFVHRGQPRAALVFHTSGPKAVALMAEGLPEDFADLDADGHPKIKSFEVVHSAHGPAVFGLEGKVPGEWLPAESRSGQASSAIFADSEKPSRRPQGSRSVVDSLRSQHGHDVAADIEKHTRKK